jgi:NTP pyrophosphatase (non-canonical NTP hydrolase)
MISNEGPQDALSTEAVPYEPMKALRSWHGATGVVKYFDQPDAYGRKKEASLRLELIREEIKEACDELLDVVNGSGDRVKLAKELADVLYVTYAAADVFDIPLPRVFDAVHASNMTKVGADGKVERRKDGKILKGPNYKEPDIASILLPGVSS